MRHLRLFVICSVAIALSSCYKDDISIEPEVDALLPIELYGRIEQVPTTRVNDDGFCDGDGVGIYVVNYNGELAGTMLDSGNQADNVKFVYNEPNNKWTPTYPIYYYNKTTMVDIIGYYPYGNISSVKDYSFEVHKDQSISTDGAMSNYEASDFLWGKAEGILPTTNRIEIKFYHSMAGVQIALVEGESWGDGEWAQVEKSALVTNTKRKATIDIETGEVTASGDMPSTGTIPYVNDGNFRAIVVPQTVTAGIAMFSLTVDGIPYVYRYRDNDAFADFEYESGKLHKFTIEVSKKGGDGLEFKLVDSSITDWESETISHDGVAREYVVINVPQASTVSDESSLKIAIEETGKDYTKIKNLKVTGEINVCDFYFMRDEMTMLTSVNLEDVVITEGHISGFGSGAGWSTADYIPPFAFNGKTMLRRVILPKSLKGIKDSAFSGSGITGAIYIPDCVTYLGDYSFGGCSELTSINLPRSLEYLGNGVFQRCYKINWDSFSLPNTLKTIGEYVFCSSVDYRAESYPSGQLVLPESLEMLGRGSFYLCNFTGPLVIPDMIKVVPSDCFSGCKFTGSLKLPNGLTKIESSAFSSCDFTGELVIPESVISIGENAFFGCDKFSGKLILPDGLLELGRYAFGYTGFEGEVEIPSEIMVVESSLFERSENIKSVILHSGIIEVENGAFSGCIQLQNVICKAKNPPTIHSGSFTSAYPIQVEVPEASLQKYQQADGWKDLMPSVYRDFNITVDTVRALNAQYEKKAIVKAQSGMEWSVSYKPDWVTVTPSSGTGKVEVTISIDGLEKGLGNRADSIVIKPIEYDYNKVMYVEQYDCNYDDGAIITNQTATVGNGVSLVFMGDCFDAKDIADGYYKEIMDEAINHFFAIEPYTTYKEYFNVYTVVGHSPDSGLPMTYSVNQESRFESQFAYGDKGFQFKFNSDKCFEYACKIPNITKENINKTLVVLIENSNVYGGITKMWSDNSAIAVCPIIRNDYPFDFRGIIQHEAGGHGFGKLADEYVYTGNFIDMCGCEEGHTQELNNGQNLGWYQNLSLKPNIYDVPWSHMIFDSQFSNYVDMYEGGFFHARGVFRSEPNSCMNNNVPYYSAISRQEIVKRIMEYAGEEYTFEKFKSKDKSVMGPVTGGTSTFSTRSVPSSTNNAVNTSHNKPEIMGDKPMLNF